MVTIKCNVFQVHVFDRNRKICQKWCYKGEGGQHVQYQIRQPFQVCGKYFLFCSMQQKYYKIWNTLFCWSLIVHNFDLCYCRGFCPRIHDIWSKIISSTGRLVECDNLSIRRFVEYDVWSTTTIGRKFVKIKSKFGQKLICTEKIKIVYIDSSHISKIFSRQYQY